MVPVMVKKAKSGLQAMFCISSIWPKTSEKRTKTAMIMHITPKMKYTKRVPVFPRALSCCSKKFISSNRRGYRALPD